MFKPPLDFSIFVRRLNETDGPAVSALRQTAYKDAGYVLSPSYKMNWGPSDRRFVVLGAFWGEELISTLRIETLETEDDMKTYVQGSRVDFGVSLPCISISRAATQGSYRKMGCWRVLRGLAIAWATQNHFEFTVSAFLESTPLKSLSERAGYQVFDAPPWEDFIKSSGPTLRARLNLRSQGQFAAAFFLESSRLFPKNFLVDQSSLNLDLNPFINHLNQNGPDEFRSY